MKEHKGMKTKDIERELKCIWEEALRCDGITIDDNMFELGGNSLKVAAIAAEIQKVFDVKIPLSEMFLLATIGQQAEYIRGASKSEYEAMESLGEMRCYETSSAEKRMYLLNRLEGDSTTYNIPGVYIIKGELDKEKIQDAFQKAVDRHETLRTSFEVQNGEIVQIIQKSADFTVEFCELEDEEQTGEGIDRYIKEFIRPFDLSKSPLLRVRLVKIRDKEYMMMMDLHHIISDGRSNVILLGEITELYEGKPLEALNVSYKDFSYWQNKHFLSDDIKKQEKYWLNTFAGDLPVLNLPTDFKRPAVKSSKGDHFNFKIDSALTLEIRKITEKTNTTLFMFLLAAFNVLLYKHTGQEDIIVGTPIAGRTRAEVGNLVGMFVNTLAMRNYPAGNKTFTDFLLELKENSIKAYENQEYQFEELLTKLDVTRDISRNPLFDVMFVMRNLENEHFTFSGCEMTPYDFANGVSKFDFTLIAFEDADEFRFTFEYCTELFLRETIERLAEHFKNILKAIVKNIDADLREIDILGEEEREKILYDFNRTRAEFQAEKTIQELFAEQAERTPDHIALVFDTQKLTYRELNQKADSLAKVLRECGAGRNHIVGLMVERSFEMIIGILAVLKAGAAYLPIDPAYPLDRIKFMLKDSGTKLLLTKGKCEYEAAGGIKVIDLEEKKLFLNDRYISSNHSNQEDLAYVIYTSGTTGRPKGVLVKHTGIISLSLFMKESLHITDSDRIIQFASVSFDASVWEIFMALLNGAELHILSKDTVSDYSRFTEYINQNSITVATLPPPYLVHINPKEVTGLKILLTAGSQISIDLALKWQPHVHYINAYGPTESTICATVWDDGEKECGFLKNAASVPIGRPIYNTKIYIVDKDNHLQPIGVAGELCISGPGLAQGYLNRPRLTAEKFAENPFFDSQDDNYYRKMYHTGDLARWLTDGNIEFLGRIDEQVKIRGFRIEPGEIEAALLKYSGVKEAAVIDREDSDKNKYLCAYFTAGREITVAELREHLGQSLPDYMIPQYFVQILEIPLSNSGKVDKKALPDPKGNINTGVLYVAAQNETEKKLTQIWSEILNAEKIGVNDNFFELGGHSLKAVSLAARIHKELEVEIPLSDIFRLVTIKLQAEYIRDAVKSNYISLKTAKEKEFYSAAPAQKRMFLVNKFENGNTTYNIPNIYTIRGKLDIGKLEDAFRKLIDRHESFRTSFEMQDGEVVQKIQKSVNFELEIREPDPSLHVEENLGRYADEFVRPFDFGKAPLIRAMLLKVCEEENILFLDMHHIIADGESMELISGEIKAFYEGESLPPLKVQYKDFSEWQNKMLASGLLEPQKSYWMQVFSGEIPLLNMLTDDKRPVIKSTKGDRIHFAIEADLAAEIRRVAKQTDTTIYMLLLAVFYVLLYKYTGQEDIVVGTPFSGRTRQETEDIVGMFVNTLGLRNYPKGNKRFLEFLAEVKDNALKAYENQDYPLEELLAGLELKRESGRNPLFDVMFAMQNVKSGQIIGGCEFRPYHYDYPVSKFDLTFIVAEDDNQSACIIEYCTDLFRKETMERFAVHFCNLLGAIVRNPDALLSNLDIVGEDEKKRLLYDFNTTNVELERGKTVHELFQEQVKKTPNNKAVVFGEQILTYDELNNRANSLANILRSKGVAANDIVGILAEPSLEMIIGILAVLKAKGAYLPIAWDNPADRISYMLTDSGTHILLSRKHLLDHVFFDGELIDLDEKDLYSSPAENPKVSNTAKDAAYVIYTSGSTGKPKGVLIRHESLVNLSVWHRQSFHVTEDDRATKYAGFGFDASVWELFPYLLSGAAVYIIDKEMRLDIDKLHHYFCENGITIGFLPTQICEQFMRFKDTSLRYLLTGGDKLTRFEESNFVLVNNYGPTENTVVTSSFIVDRPYDSIPIGKPVFNSRIYIIDQNRHIQPIGVAGELCVSGIGLAKGYLNRPELTAEKFIDNPFANQEEDDDYRLMYCTGDLARWLPDGNIEFLGRIDEQVKIRGYRIELGEIQAVLKNYGGIKEAVVIAKEEEEHNKYLCAYYTADGEIPASVLREHVRKELPDYMVPPFLIQLPAIPLTSNGKVDIRALPEPDGTIDTGVEYEEPKTETEKRLVRIWHDVLGVERIGINDNFFELGGHSLKAVSLAAKIHKEFHIEIPISELFHRNNIKEQAEYMEKAVPGSYMSIMPADQKDYYPVSSTQKRMYLQNQIEEGSTSYNIPYAFLIKGDIDRERLKRALQEIVNRHDSFRTSFEIKDGDIVQRIHKDLNFVLEFKTIGDKEAAEETIQNCIDDFICPFDLHKIPLIRACLIKTDEKEHLFLLDMHHIIADGVSMGIMLRELAAVYRGENLPPVKLQYKDFSEWSNRLSGNGVIEKQERYWLDIFSGEIPLLNMPLDFKRPALRSFEGDRVEFALGNELTGTLKTIAERTDTTMFMLLLAAYYVLLYKYTGQEDIVVGTPVSGRRYEEETDIIGMFVNTLAMRNFPKGEKTFREFLKEIKENSLGAFENQEYQFDELLSKLDVKRDMSRNPLFDVMFVMQNLADNSMKLPGCEIKPYHFKSNISKFDLTLIASEDDGKLQFLIEYDTALFLRETIERFAAHLENLLGKIAESIDTSLSDLDIIGEEEKNDLQNVFQKEQNHPLDEMLIDELFHNQVRKTPDQIAVIIGERQITYQELERKSNSLAGVLREYGIGPNVIAGIMLKRSMEMVIALLGVLKAGGTYLPIDVNYPSERIDYMIQDSNPKLLLVKGRTDYKVREDIKVIDLLNEELYQDRAEELKTIHSPEDTAYIIYTSGTTGRPKGVLIRHKSLANTIQWRKKEYGFTEKDTTLQLFSFCFDGFVTSFYSPLISGAVNVFVSDEELRDPKLLIQSMIKYQVTHFITVPSFYSLILENLGKEAALSLRVITLAGEKLPQNLVRLSKIKCPGTEIANEYGPTENCVATTVFRNVEEKDVIPIGKPIWNSRVYIVDKNNGLQPIGVAGELCVSGIGLAKGYLNQPELTKEKFTKNPFEGDTESIYQSMYHTGDLARWLPDGNIEFLGRIDCQVKIRGFRIEPGEIENVLLKREDISEAVVIDREDQNGNKYLCAYYVSDQEIGSTLLRNYLRESLPDYMVPQYLIRISHIPVTSTGKMDRKSLPEPAGAIDTGTGYEAPKNDIENKLVSIWQEILGTQRVGVNESFFEVGGDSLSIVKVSNRIEEIYPGIVKVTDLFTYRSIKELAEFIAERSKGSGFGTMASVLPPVGEKKQTGPEAKKDTDHGEDAASYDTVRDIAVIGISARMPMAENVDEFWKNIKNGCDCVSGVPKERKGDLEDLLDGLKMKDAKYRELAYLKEIDKFDYNFFGISPREASLMDPNQRIFLETAWGAMEDAGYGGDALTGSRTGVFLGYGSEAEYQMFVNTFLPSYTSVSLTGNIAPNIASRISYFMDFCGPNMLINTTCSSSLVALHTACQSIKNRECSQAIVGGIKLILLPIEKNGDMGILSTDARTRTFDDSSDGTGSGEGAIAILIKPLEQALKDRDHIYAVIKGSAVNHGGKSISIAAPNPAAQEDVIVRAWKDADIDPDTIRYIEAHGTGTKLGDPIEIEGIKRAFDRYTDKKQFCAIGSVKSNINHLDCVSGLAGLLKAVLSLKNKEIPPTLHFHIPNRNIDFSDSPVFINRRLRPWEFAGYPRRCGVSSFGMSGTNCHVVLEEAPLWDVNHEESDYSIFTLSAKSKNSLKEITASYIKLLNEDTSVDIGNLCYTANTGRGHYNHRIAVIAADTAELCSALEMIEKADLAPMMQDNIYCGVCEEVSGYAMNRAGRQAGEEAFRIYLNELAKLYVEGFDINWDELYRGRKYYRLSLPTYCFEKTRCWLDTGNKAGSVDDMLYQTGWLHKETGLTTENADGRILLLHDGSQKANKLVRKLIQKGYAVTELYGTDEKELAKTEEFFASGRDERLKVVHCASLRDDLLEVKSIEQLKEKLDMGVYALQRVLTKLSGFEREIDFILISEYAYRVTKKEKHIFPENAVMNGFGKNIHNEDHRILCRCIDIDEDTDLDHVVNELNAGTFDYNVAYRENQRYVEEVEKYDTASLEGGKIQIRENGVYVITGGLGYIGMELSRFLSSKCHVNIALIQRSDFPDRSLWSKIDCSENEKLAKQIEFVKELEGKGCNVGIWKADVANERELEEALRQIRDKYGAIHGIFHCAAIGVGRKGRRILDEVPEKLNYTMGPKIQGTWLLHKLTKDDGLDFMMLFSSAIVLMGGIRASAYVAGNAYLDAFADLGAKDGSPVIAVDWPTWSDIAVSPVNDNHMFLPFSTKDAMKVLERILNVKMSRCIVGNMNTKSDLFLLSKTLPFRLSGELQDKITANQTEEKSGKIDVTLTGRSDGGYTRMEKEVAGIIGSVLAVHTIDINDNFFDLGGSSITSIKLEADFETMGIEFKSSDIYEYSTVADIAAFIEGKRSIKGKTAVPARTADHDMETATKLEHIKGNYSIFYKSCFYNSLFPVMDYFQKDINVFLVNDVIAYKYVQSKNGANILDVNYMEVETFEKIIDQAGLKFTAKYYSEDVLGDMIHSVENKKPVLIYVDCYYVPIREDCYQKTHLAHTWLVYGFDRTNKKIHILEHKSLESLNYAEKTVSYQEVENAYIGFNDYFNTEETMFSYYEFELKPGDDPYEKEEYKTAFAWNTVQYKAIIWEGFKTLKQYAKGYPGLISSKGQFLKNAEDIFQAANHIINAKKIEEFRWLRLFGDKENDILNLMKEIITEWSHIRVKIGKCIYTSTYRKEILDSTAKEMNRIIGLEEELNKKQLSMFETMLLK